MPRSRRSPNCRTCCGVWFKEPVGNAAAPVEGGSTSVLGAVGRRTGAARRGHGWASALRSVGGRPTIAVVAALGLLGVLGGVLVDDYGVPFDEVEHRELGHATLGDEAALKRLERYFPASRHYGTAFQSPLALVERALGQADGRHIYLTRHLLTHLAFLAGAGAAALLARRLFGGTWPALFALAAFALHPRLYAHSFFNTKDAPFAALFMVCLCLAERAFRRGTAGAFALLGAGVGVLVNLRVMGALLFAAVLGLRALDVARAPGRAARRRALGSGAVFVAAAAAALYAVSPHLWPDPSRLVDTFALFTQYPHRVPALFAGAVVRWPDIPAHYVPTWIAVTTPPALLALCLAGAAAALGHGLAPLDDAVRAAPPRFGLLLVACPVLAVAAVVALNANIYHGWRHLYFLWAPASLLAVTGTRWLAGAGRRRGLRRVVGGLAAVAVAAATAQLALIHPQQHSYFNLLVDRDAPERLANRYDVDRWRMFYHTGLRQVLKRHPWATVMDGAPDRDMPHALGDTLLTLPEAQRQRIGDAGPLSAAADILVSRRVDRRACGGRWPAVGLASAHLAVRVYDNTCFTARALDVAFMGDAPAQALRAAYRAAAGGAPLVRSGYDLHLGPSELTFLKEPCGDVDLRGEFAFTAFRGAPGGTVPAGADEKVVCDFAGCGARIGDACMVQMPRPTGPLRAIVAGQRLPVDGPDLWRVAVELGPEGAVATDTTRPMVPAVPPLPAVAPFDLHLDGATLVYARESCRPEDTWPRFFLHVFPADPSTLPEARRRIGFHNLDFRMEDHDAALLARLGGRCVAWRRLPDGPIARLRTGQLGLRGERLWLAEFVEPR